MSNPEEIRVLLDEGLTHYGLGEVQKALGVWKRVLELEPGNPRAMEYIRFVEENWAPNQDRGEDPYRPDEGTDPNKTADPGSVAQAGPESQTQSVGGDSEPAPAPAPAPVAGQGGFVSPIKSEAGQWGDLYDYNKGVQEGPPVPAATPPADPAPVQGAAQEAVSGAEVVDAPIPGPPPGPIPDPISEPIAAPISEPTLPPPGNPGASPAAPAAPPPDDGLPPEAEGDDGFASWDSKVWSKSPAAELTTPQPDTGPVEKIESSTLPARPDPPDDPGDPAPPASQPLPDPPAIPVAAPDTPADTPEATPQATPQAAPEVTPAATPEVTPAAAPESTSDANPATDGWGTLGAPVKTDPDLRIDPELKSAFSAPPSGIQKLVIEPNPPFPEGESIDLDSMPGFDLASDPAMAMPDEFSAPLELQDQAQDLAQDLDAERFSLDSDTDLQAEAPSSALGLVGGGGLAIEDDEVSGEFDSVTALMHGVSDMLELDDFSGAVELLDKVLDQDPDHSEAARLRQEAEGELLKMYESKIGDMSRAPEVRMASDEIIWLNLDNRAGFLLSMIDGQTSYDDLLAVSGLPRLDVMRILVQLLQEKVVDVA